MDRYKYTHRTYQLTSYENDAVYLENAHDSTWYLVRRKRFGCFSSTRTVFISVFQLKNPHAFWYLVLFVCRLHLLFPCAVETLRCPRHIVFHFFPNVVIVRLKEIFIVLVHPAL